MHRTSNINVAGLKPLVTPEELKRELPLSGAASDIVAAARADVQAILAGRDERLLAIVGPCSIHDTGAALEYAAKLAAFKETVVDQLYILMRTYFGKPRTTVGWKGIINDPNLDGSYDVARGLRRAREVLLGVTELGVPTATEMLDPIVPQYIADAVCWASIGARTTESQTHREMASGLSMPVGFKNSTDGNLQVAINAVVSACEPHHFIGIDGQGRTAVIETNGNPWCHLILRGGSGHPNYDPVSIANAEDQLAEAGLKPRIIVDCSHDNSGKRPQLQAHVMRSVLSQRIEGNTALKGFMLESFLRDGSQKVPQDIGALEYGVSITDPCLGWEATEQLLAYACKRLAKGERLGD